MLVKQQKGLVKKGGDVREITGGVFLLTLWLIGIKHPKQITFSKTNTVMLLIIVIIIDS